MRYCKFLSFEPGIPVPRYAPVEQRDDALWAISPMAPPEEDLAAHLAAHPPHRLPAHAPLRPSPPPPRHPLQDHLRRPQLQDHAAELGNEVPKEPLLFLKPPSSLLAPGGIIRMPALSKRVDYEGELAIVIGRRCRNLGPTEDIRPYIRGYILVNDVTARDIQKSDGQWTRGKGFDTFCPAGPIVSNEIDPATGSPVTLTTRLNGEVKQHGSTADLIFPIPHLLRYITAFITLEPGDIIPTGTPAGVGPVQPGDRIQVEIDGLGTLENPFAAEI